MENEREDIIKSLGDCGFFDADGDGYTQSREDVADFILADRERTRIEAERAARLKFIDQLLGNTYALDDVDTSKGWLGESLLEYLEAEQQRLIQPTHKAQEGDHAENT